MMNVLLLWVGWASSWKKGDDAGPFLLDQPPFFLDDALIGGGGGWKGEGEVLMVY